MSNDARADDWFGSRYAFSDEEVISDHVDAACGAIELVTAADEDHPIEGMTWQEIQAALLAQVEVLSQPYRLVVAGVQNSGKSTVVNVLLGQWLMPSVSRNVDAVLTRITWAAEQHAEVVYRDGTRRESTIEEVRRLVDQKHKGLHDEQAKVDHCVIYLPNENLKTFVLVNTPGLEDKAHITSRTRSFFKEADAILWVFDANRVEEVSIADEVLGLCREQGHRIVALLNQIDLVRRSAGDEGVELVQERFESLFGGTYRRVFPVSARNAADGLSLRPTRNPPLSDARQTLWKDSGFDALDGWFQSEMFGRDKRAEKRSGVLRRINTLQQTALKRASGQARMITDWLEEREEERSSVDRVQRMADRTQRKIERKLRAYCEEQARRLIDVYLSVIERVAEEVIGIRASVRRSSAVADELQAKLEEEVARVLPPEHFAAEVSDAVASIILDGWDDFIDEVDVEFGDVKVDAASVMGMIEVRPGVETVGLGRAIRAVVRTAIGLGLKAGGQRLVKEPFKRAIQLMVRKVVEQIVKLIGKRFTVTLLRNLAKWISPLMWLLAVADLEAARRDIQEALAKGRAELKSDLRMQEDAVRLELTEEVLKSSREVHLSIKRSLAATLGDQDELEEEKRQLLSALEDLKVLVAVEVDHGT